MISAVIVSLNELDKLKKCLESIKDFAKEIIVIDLDSNDETIKMAKEYGKVYHYPKVPYVEVVRNWAINKASGDWILVLDPDEVLPLSLATYLKKNINHDLVAFNIPRQNIFFNCWIKHSNFWPDRQIRFFKRGTVDWPVKIHTYPQVLGKLQDVEAKSELAIIHFGYSSYSEFIKRQERYSQIEIQERIRDNNKSSIVKLIRSPFRIFLVRFIKYRAFLDGLNGIFIVLILMFYKFKVEWKLLKTRS